jgi:hypothetical protein
MIEVTAVLIIGLLPLAATISSACALLYVKSMSNKVDELNLRLEVLSTTLSSNK